jgi:hypothetical protein
VSSPRRRHRFITASSGLLLFACLFLPVAQSCGREVAPYEARAYPPYVIGLLVMALALAGPGPRAVITELWRVLMWIGIACTAMFALVIGIAMPWIAIVALASAIGFAYVIGGDPATDELAAARVVIATALLGIEVLGIVFIFADNLLFGAYVAAAACLGMFVGAIEWRREVLAERSGPEFPSAKVRATGACPNPSPTT